MDVTISLMTDDELQALGMRLRLTRFAAEQLSAIADLLRRAQEIRLSARDFSVADCAAMMSDAAMLPLYASLSDRAGEHGVIAVLVLEQVAEELAIREWAMAGAVMDRGIEQHLMNCVVEEAQARRCTRVSGEFVRTRWNAGAEEFYAQFGFTMVGGEADHALWILPVSAYEPMETFVVSG